jgi:uncharacterized repeat protein (TIGR01451 family)
MSSGSTFAQSTGTITAPDCNIQDNPGNTDFTCETTVNWNTQDAINVKVFVSQNDNQNAPTAISSQTSGSSNPTWIKIAGTKFDLYEGCSGSTIGTCNSLLGSATAFARGCRDGVVNGIEECDDGNNLNNDGCSAQCEIEDNSGPTDCTVIFERGGTPEYPDPDRLYMDWSSSGTIDPILVREFKINTGGVIASSPIRSYSIPNNPVDGPISWDFSDLSDPDIQANVHSKVVRLYVTDLDGNVVTHPSEGNATCQDLFYLTRCDNGNSQCVIDFEGGDGAYCENDSQCAPSCGNSFVEVGEQCDDGNTNNGDGCDASCQIEIVDPICGNGVREAGEQCDDGNTTNGDGCNSQCQNETTTNNSPPRGFLDAANCTNIAGWTCDPDNYSTALTVELFVDGVATGITTVANSIRGQGVADRCGGDPAHGYVFSPTPSSLLTGNPINLTVVSRGVNSNGDPSGATRILPNSNTQPTPLITTGLTPQDCASCTDECDPGDHPFCTYGAANGGGTSALSTCTLQADGCYDEGTSACATDQWCQDTFPGSCENTGLCGNGTRDFAEECDDGNTSDDDGCSSTCQIGSQCEVLVNTARITPTSGETDNNPINNSNSTTLSIGPGCEQGEGIDLSITKTAEPLAALVGDTITYTLGYNWNHPISTGAVIVDDYDQTTLTKIQFSGKSEEICTDDGDVITCNVGVGGRQATFALIYTAEIIGDPNSTTCESIINTATISPTTGEIDINPKNDIASATVLFGDRCIVDLSVTKTADPIAALAGDNITYTLGYNWNHPFPTGAVIVDDYDQGVLMNIQFSGKSEEVCTDDGDIITCNVGVGGRQATFALIYTAEITREGANPFTCNSIINTATISPTTGEIDINPKNDIASTTVEFGTTCTGVGPSLEVIKTTTEPIIQIGGDVTFDFIVRNTGTEDLTNVILTDTLDSNFIFVPDTPPNPNVSTGVNLLTGETTITISIGNLSVGAEVSFDLTFRVSDQTPNGSLICNQASGIATELTAAIDSLEICIIGTNSPLIVTKNAVPPSGSTVNAGDEITFTITVQNAGNTAMTNVIVTDLLDPNFNFVREEPDPDSGASIGTIFETTGVTYDPATRVITLDFATLAVGEIDNLVFTLQVDPATPNNTTLINVATASADGVPPVDSIPTIHNTPGGPGNNELELIKTAVPISGSTVTPGSMILYTIEAQNNSNQDYTNVVIIDDLDANLTFVPDTPVNPIVTNTGQVIRFDVGDLAANASTSVSFTAEVNTSASKGTQIPNTAQISATELTTPLNSNPTIHVVPRGGGGGGGDTNPTIGTCTVHQSTGALQCTPRYPFRDTSDPDYEIYRVCIDDLGSNGQSEASCLLNWATSKEYTVCGPTIGGNVEVPLGGSLDVDLDGPLIASQCDFTPELPPSCEVCPSCFGANQFIEKSVQDKDGNWVDSIHIPKQDNVRYKIELTLGLRDNEEYQINAGSKVRLYDFTIPTDQGNIWKRDGFDSQWNWEGAGRYFERPLSTSEIQDLNNGAGTIIELEYEMKTELALNPDAAKIQNVAFAMLTYNYDKIETDGTTTTETKHFSVGLEGPNGQSCTIDRDSLLGLESATSSLGDRATVNIIRPFVQTRGSNIGINLTEGGQKPFGTNSEATSGQIFVNEKTNDSLFENVSSLLRKVTDFTGITDLSDQNDYLNSVKRSAIVDATISNEIQGGRFSTTADNTNIFFTKGNVILSGTYDARGESQTFIIEANPSGGITGSLTVAANFQVANGFVAFIVRDGDLIIEKEVENIEGLFIVESGSITSNETSYTQLNVSGGLTGNAEELLQMRKYIGVDPATEIEPSVKINFDIRLLNQTPPALEQFLGSNWQEEAQ